jgi:FAD:protein FMN transferase
MTSRAGLELHQHAFKAMGSPCDIQLYGDSREATGRVAALAIAEVERLEARYSRYREDSLLSQINRTAAVGGRFVVDEETAGLLDYAGACFEQSGGLFDITSGLLRRAWRFDSGQVPEPARIDALLGRVGWDKLRWRAPALDFPVAGMEIDFGGVVKEYAVDRVAALCREAGARHGRSTRSTGSPRSAARPGRATAWSTWAATSGSSARAPTTSPGGSASATPAARTRWSPPC